MSTSQTIVPTPLSTTYALRSRKMDTLLFMLQIREQALAQMRALYADIFDPKYPDPTETWALEQTKAEISRLEASIRSLRACLIQHANKQIDLLLEGGKTLDAILEEYHETGAEYAHHHDPRDHHRIIGERYCSLMIAVISRRTH